MRGFRERSGAGLVWLKAARPAVDAAGVIARNPSGGWVIGTPEQFRWMHGVVKALLVLNLLDALFTLVWIQLGLAREANPLLRNLVETQPVLFVATKLALVGAASWLLWRRRHRPLAVIAIFVAFLLYYALLLYHLGFLSLVVKALLAAA